MSGFRYLQRTVFCTTNYNSFICFSGLIHLSAKEILSLQREKIEEKERFEEARNKIMKGRGHRAKPVIDVFNDES